ncbi:sulfotransferase [Nisaea acidiphila]|uniref:Sulfotransferase n=1 Tax=Nisaea acidiphila TaxID=1862145 RepID=A0A9J7B0Z0_9PROT|nr:sulfotransferase [Nisaea acidiphila]UUX51349.1 sulfotransferase [Nisaea acidiphila]
MAQEANVPDEVADIVRKAIGAFQENSLSDAIIGLEAALRYPMPEETCRDICCQLSDWCTRTGDLGRARRHLIRAILLMPGDTRTRLEYAELALVDSPALGLPELLAQVRRDRSARSALSLARIFLRRGEVKRSVALARLGNARERKTRGLSRTAILDQWNERKNRLVHLRPHWQRRDWYFGQRGDVQNVFICGVPRSGSTLLELMLLSMEGVASVGESPEVQECLAAGLAGKPALTLRDLKVPAKIVLNKLMDNIYLADFILEKIRNAKILIINRNPESVFFSNYMQKYQSDWDICYEDSTLADFIDDVRKRSEMLAAQWPGRVMAIDYEQLTRDPLRTFMKISVLLGLEGDRFDGQHLRADTVHTASKLAVRQPLRDDMNQKYLKAARFMPYLRNRYS